MPKTNTVVAKEVAEHIMDSRSTGPRTNKVHRATAAGAVVTVVMKDGTSKTLTVA